MHTYAQTLLTCVSADLQDPAAARRYAQRAVAMTHRQDAALFTTLALTYHCTGDHARALVLVKEGLVLAPGDAVQRQELEVQRASAC